MSLRTWRVILLWRLYLPDLDEVALFDHIKAQFTVLRYFSLDETYGVGLKEPASTVGQ
jgi:hypothetical protein